MAERLAEAEVPEGVEPHLGPNDTPVGQVFQYTLESDRHSPSELRSWQDWVVSKQLMRAPGVADVVSFGGYQKEYHVIADTGRLRAEELTLDDVIQAVAVSNGAKSGGYLKHGESEFVVRGRAYLRNMLEGIALVSIVVWLFLRAIIGSLAVSITMPLSLLAAFVGLYYAGVPANLLSSAISKAVTWELSWPRLKQRWPRP